MTRCTLTNIGLRLLESKAFGLAVVLCLAFATAAKRAELADRQALATVWTRPIVDTDPRPSPAHRCRIELRYQRGCVDR